MEPEKAQSLQSLSVSKIKDLELLKTQVIWQKINQLCLQFNQKVGKGQFSSQNQFICLMLNGWRPQFQKDIFVQQKKQLKQVSNKFNGAASQIFINKAIKCDLCQQKSTLVLQNICTHKYCRNCLELYIPHYYKQQEDNSDKTLLPPCLIYQKCRKMLSHIFVIQTFLIINNRNLLKKFKVIVAKNFIQKQWKLKLTEIQEESQFKFEIQRRNANI